MTNTDRAHTPPGSSEETGSPLWQPGRDRNWMFNLRWGQSGADDLHENILNLNALVAEGVMRRMPGKAEMRQDGPDALLDGWLPREPLIGPDTRVIAIGSCFAGVFAEWLAENGYNRGFDPMSDQSLVRNPLETPLAVAQQFRWAFGEFDSDLAFWFTPDKQRIEATEERREELRRTFASAEVMVITLGLAEAWIDSQSGEAIWRYPPRGHRTERFHFKIASVAESVEALETIDRLRRTHAPQAKIVYTLSPIRLAASFRPISPVVSNVASKAILRAALDEFLRAHQAELNETYFYFPSYEVVTQLLDDPYEDNMHIHPHHANLVIDLFARHYTTLPSSAQISFHGSVEAELRETIAHLEDTTIANLERRLEWLQGECDQRQVVIDELKATCDARLALIQRVGYRSPEEELLETISTLEAEKASLQVVCDERLGVIERLDAEVRRVRDQKGAFRNLAEAAVRRVGRR